MTQNHDRIVTITSAHLQPLWLKKLVTGNSFSALFCRFGGNLNNVAVVNSAEVRLKMQLDAELLELICWKFEKYFIWFSLGILLLSNKLCYFSSARRLFQSHDGGGGRCSGRIPELLPDRTGHYEEAALLRGAHTRQNTVDHQVETFVIGEMRQTLHTTCCFKNVVLTWWKRLMQSWDVETKALFSVMLDFVTITIKLIFYYYYYQT